MATYALKQSGGRRAFAYTLNLGPLVERRARQDSTWLRRALVRRIGSDVPLLIVFDSTRWGRLHPRGRLHLHGAFVAAHASDVARIKAAMELAGGEWASRRGQPHQCEIDPLGDESGPIFGWARYLKNKLAPASRAIADGPLWSVTGVARRAAKALHDAIRRTVNARSAHVG